MTMTTKYAMRAAELWVQDRDGYLLEFGDGLYGDAFEFETVSRQLVFGRGEGLPGRTWEEGRPQWIASLEGSYFRRIRQARDAGYGAAVGIPFFVGRALDAVLVLFFGDAHVEVELLDDVGPKRDDVFDLHCADFEGTVYTIRLPDSTERPVARAIAYRKRIEGDTARPRFVRPTSGNGSLGQVILQVAGVNDTEFVAIDL